LDTSDNAVNPANPVNYNKVIPIELTEQNIRQVAIDHYQDSDAYVDIPSDSSKYTAAIGESSKIVLTDKGTGNNANFDHAEDVASYLDNFFGDNIIGN
jgi:hypothetical protein